MSIIFLYAIHNKEKGHLRMNPFADVLFSVSILLLDHIVSSEIKGNAPQGRNSHQSKDDAAEDSSLAAKDGSDEIKTKDTDGTPVESADDNECQCDFI